MGLNKQTSPSWRKKSVNEWLCTKQLPSGAEQTSLVLTCGDSHWNCAWSKTGREKDINSFPVLQGSEGVKTISHSITCQVLCSLVNKMRSVNALLYKTPRLSLLIHITTMWWALSWDGIFDGAETKQCAVRNSPWQHWICSQGWKRQTRQMPAQEGWHIYHQACTEAKTLRATFPQIQFGYCRLFLFFLILLSYLCVL